MRPMSFFRRTTKCVMCNLAFKRLGPTGSKAPESYICDDCSHRIGKDRAIHGRVIIVRDWHELDDKGCIGCGETMWGIDLRLTEPVEMTDVRAGERELWMAGTEGTYTECPNPDCSFAWGRRASSDNIVERMPFLVPPWAQAPRARLAELGLAAYMELQIRMHREWWDARRAADRRER